MHRRVWEFYSREQTQGEILRLKNVRVKTSLSASGVTVWCREGRVALFVPSIRSGKFSDATNETCGRVLDARERFRAFRRRKKFLPQKRSFGKSASLSHSSRFHTFSLCLSHGCVPGSFAAEKNYDETRLCSPFTISADNTFPFS